jgi:hypothetical protein
VHTNENERFAEGHQLTRLHPRQLFSLAFECNPTPVNQVLQGGEMVSLNTVPDDRFWPGPAIDIRVD